MWMRDGKEFKSEDIGQAIGFIYIITEISTNRRYIGKRNFYSTRTLPALRGKSRKRKKTFENDWQDYHGSNEELKALVEAKGSNAFKREILHLAYTKGELSFLELKEQVERNVLLDPSYFNQFIGVRIHAKHLSKMTVNA